MPRGNKTGPNGMGPMTGRRMGLCVGNSNVEIERNQGVGNGFGRGVGRGAGRGSGRNFSYQGNQFQQNFSDKEGDCFELEANDEFLQHDIQELVKEVMKLRDSL